MVEWLIRRAAVQNVEPVVEVGSGPILLKVRPISKGPPGVLTMTGRKPRSHLAAFMLYNLVLSDRAAGMQTTGGDASHERVATCSTRLDILAEENHPA